MSFSLLPTFKVSEASSEIIMNSLIFSLTVLALVVCLSIIQASALRCYECHNFPSEDGYSGGNDDSTCKKVDPSMIAQCPESDELNKYENVCRTFMFKKQNSDITYIKRSCGKLQFENIKEFYGAKNDLRELTEGTPATSMICNTDLCNAASDIPQTKLILFMSAMLSVSSSKYFY